MLTEVNIVASNNAMELLWRKNRDPRKWDNRPEPNSCSRHNASLKDERTKNIGTHHGNTVYPQGDTFLMCLNLPINKRPRLLLDLLVEPVVRDLEDIVNPVLLGHLNVSPTPQQLNRPMRPKHVLVQRER